MLNWLVEKLIKFAKRTPYTHLYHEDGSVYMERFWLVPVDWKWPFAARIHWIATPDHDRHLHDHPWAFLSLILWGSYIEARPVTVQPCFEGEREVVNVKLRRRWSLAFRHATDRHYIPAVSPGGVWTLFISFKFVQWWGFYTPMGKVYYRDYHSVHTLEKSYAQPKATQTA